MINFRVWACTLSPLSSTAKHSQILLVDQFFSRFGRWSLYHSHGLVFLAVQAEAENSSIGDCHSLTHSLVKNLGGNLLVENLGRSTIFDIHGLCVFVFVFAFVLVIDILCFCLCLCIYVFVLAFLYVFVLVQGWAGKAFWLPGTGREIENHIPVLREGNGNSQIATGREGKFETCIPGNHGKREFPLTPGPNCPGAIYPPQRSQWKPDETENERSWNPKTWTGLKIPVIK